MGQVLALGIMLGAVYAIVSYGLTLIFGVIRVVNFAHGSLLMIGMFLSYYFSTYLNMNIYVTLIIVVPLMFILGILIQQFLINPVLEEHVMQLFVTFGLLLLLENVVLAITRGSYYSIPMNMGGIEMGSVILDWPRIIILLGTFLLAVFLLVFLNKTRIGTEIRAISQNRYAAQLIGLKVKKIYLIAFGLGSAAIGVAAVLITPLYTIFPHIGFNFVIISFAVVILGGLGSIPGALVGGFIIGIVEALSGYFLSPDLKQIVWYLIFLAVLFFKPAGIFGIVGSEEVGVK